MRLVARDTPVYSRYSPVQPLIALDRKDIRGTTTCARRSQTIAKSNAPLILSAPLLIKPLFIAIID